MRKKFILGAGAMMLSVSVTVLSVVSTNGSYPIFTSDVEALTSAETCISSSNQKLNTGHCEAAVDGTGDYCMEKGVFEKANCMGNRVF